MARVGEFIWRIVPALALGYLIMGLLWPWSILAPLNPVRAAEYFDKFFEKPWRELYAGKIISVTAMPADYLPRLFALKLPEIMLVLGLAGGLLNVFLLVGAAIVCVCGGGGGTMDAALGAMQRQSIENQRIRDAEAARLKAEKAARAAEHQGAR